MDGLAIYGAVTGTVGTIAGMAALVISIFAYRRDVGSLKVSLLRNMRRVAPGLPVAELFELHRKLENQFGDSVPPLPPDIAALDPEKRWAYIDVVNSGRRDIHFEKAALLYEDGSTYLALESNPETLSESRPLSVRIDEDLIDKAEKEQHTKLLCAFAINSLGRNYYSDVPKDKRALLKRLRRKLEAPIRVPG